jgi:hypothetical protein
MGQAGLGPLSMLLLLVWHCHAAGCAGLCCRCSCCVPRRWSCCTLLPPQLLRAPLLVLHFAAAAALACPAAGCAALCCRRSSCVLRCWLCCTLLPPQLLRAPPLAVLHFAALQLLHAFLRQHLSGNDSHLQVCKLGASAI